MAEKPFTKKLTKIAAFILGGIVVLLVAFHFWFVNHAEELIENMVEDQSHGKLKLDIHKFKFNWFSRKMELQQAVFISTDTLNSPIAYRFQVDKIKVQVKKVWPLIFEKRFLIDSIQLINPKITVSKLRNKDSTSVSDTTMSIPQEMGRIYNSIQDALQVLKVDRFQIDNGTFSLVDKTQPEEKPIVISRLYFHLDNLQVDTTATASKKQKILFSDDVSLRTTNQDILFPDGRHRLSFSNFRINIRSKMAEFDSCTIMATKGDSSSNSFRIFFDKLRMTNIDFDTLYHTEVIKADSVYCINPRFKLDVELSKSTDPVQPPKLNELIQQLTGNLQLAFVVVQNGSFDITTMRNGHPSSFTSDHNNFELQGLRIRENAPRPLTVERFVMAIRNYENFLRDSTYAMQFDSILINDNRISLSNYSYKELDKNNKVINWVNMPQFELQGLSWDNLVFDQQLAAQRVTLYRPVINYNIGKSKNRSSKDVFQALAGIGKVMQLDNLDIVNGQVNLSINKQVQLKLEDATMSISAKQLVDAKKVRSIQRSVNSLHFRKGTLTIGDITAHLDNVQYNGSNNGFRAGSIVAEKKNTFLIKASDASISTMVANDDFNEITIDGVKWHQANVQLYSFSKAGTASKDFILKNIKGYNTSISVAQGDKKMSVFLDQFAADDLSLLKGHPISITGLTTHGYNLDITDSKQHLTVETVSILDNRPSYLENIIYNKHTAADTIAITIPSLAATPDINSILQGKIFADNVTVAQPQLNIKLTAESEASDNTPAEWKDILIGNILIQQPILHFINTNEKGTSSLDWKGQGTSNFFALRNLKVNKEKGQTVEADQLRFSMDHFIYTDAKGKKFNAGEGRVITEVNQLRLRKNEAESWDWKGVIASLAARNFIIDSLGKKGGTLEITWAKLSDLTVNSSYLLNLRDLVSHNTKFNLREITGNYHNATTSFNWYNASYDKKTKFFAVDSFSFEPVADRDAYVKSHPYQTDYMKARIGSITVGPFDVDRLVRDTVLDLGTVNINDGYMTDYRDKRIPRKAGTVTLLPVDMLKNIPLKVTVDTINVNNAHIEYEEVNEKTKTGGKIIVGRLNGTVATIKNFDLSDKDSLRVTATTYLQDTILTKLYVRTSYTDSLGGFLMNASMGPADLTILNPVLIPLASAALKSAKLDTLSMRVTGREKLAWGEMKMYYHDLKVRITRPGETNKKTFFAGIVSFFANTIIKNRNDHRTGTIFFQRLRDRSAINYLVKIALSGMTSSIGIQKNKKLAKKHKKEILDRNLPSEK